MFCKNCGSQLDDRAVICPHCGTPTDNYQQQAPYNPAPNTVDSRSGGCDVLCFIFPVVGLILYLIWKDTLPLRARSCGKGALIGVIVWVVLTILYIVLIVAAAGLAYSTYSALIPAIL